MDKGTIVRGVLFILAWINSFLASMGLKTIPVLDQSTVAMIVTFVISAYTFYKHNIFGKKGKQLKDAIMKETEAVIEKVIDSKVKADQPVATTPVQPEPVQPTAPTEQQPK